MYGQMTAGSWIYIGTQGILQGTYQTYLAAAEQHFGVPSLRGKLVLTSGLGGMSGAQPLAVTLNDGVIIDVEVRPERVERKLSEGYCDRMTASVEEALAWARSSAERGTAAEHRPRRQRRGRLPGTRGPGHDSRSGFSDQTPAHDLGAYVPSGDLAELDALRSRDLAEYHRRALGSIARHVEAILEMQRRGAIAFDYGNNLRAQAEAAGVDGARRSRRVPLSGLRAGLHSAAVRARHGAVPLGGAERRPARHSRARRRAAATVSRRRGADALDPAGRRTRAVPGTARPASAGSATAIERVRPAHERADQQSGAISAPVVIGRDHLDCGSVASPDRETEAMRDGSDAIADWPLLNFALNTAAGASWVSFHHGGGVGIGNSLHAGMVIVADGSDARAERLERVLTVDPGIGVARHALAGYEPALETARSTGHEAAVTLPRTVWCSARASS